MKDMIKTRIWRLQFLNWCVNPLCIYILYRCLVSRVLFPLSFANQCSDQETQLLSVSQVNHLFVSQRYYLQLLAPGESFLSVFQSLSFQLSALSTKFSTVFQKAIKQSSYFLKILNYSWDHSILIISYYQIHWGLSIN